MTTTIDELRQRKLRSMTVSVDGLGDFRVRVLSGTERMQIAQLARAKPNDELALLRKMLELSVIDDDGKHMFTPQTIDVLLDCDGEAVQRLVEAVQELSGFGADAVQLAKKN